MDSPTFSPPNASARPWPVRLVGHHVLTPLAAALALGLVSSNALSNGPAGKPAADVRQARETGADSGLRGELFYQLLVSEMQVNQGQPGAGFSLMLEAARKQKRTELFRRAVEIALQARSGESALQAARAWTDSQPRSAEAQRSVLQILLALDRPSELTEPLQTLLRLVPPEQRQDLIAALPQTLSRLNDKQAALRSVSPVLTEAARQPRLAGAAWTSLGRLQLAAGQKDQALESGQKAMAMAGQSVQPAWLALLLFEQQQPGAEPLLQRWLEQAAGPDAHSIRLEYARLLAEQQRKLDASRQIDTLTRERPEVAEPWLLGGLLALQTGRLDEASRSLQRYLSLQSTETSGRGPTQARLLLSETAEQQGRLDQAIGWLEQIEDDEAQPAVQARRALLLARQGRLPEARAMLRSLPASGPADERRKLLTEAQLLRDLGHYDEALGVYAEAMQRFPQDSDIAYERAMVAEKTGRIDEMERLLRELIERAPDYGHAYNALGYSLADRNQNLDEARELIRRALALLPDDPFIQDSLGWVEFRLGNLTEARRLLQGAFDQRADAEIAAHLGEVLWTLGERDAARQIWQRGLQLQPDNDTLKRTLQRLQVSL